MPEPMLPRVEMSIPNTALKIGMIGLDKIRNGGTVALPTFVGLPTETF